ncbi:unnamed protein product, partial [Schistosoma mattheei]
MQRTEEAVSRINQLESELKHCQKTNEENAELVESIRSHLDESNKRCNQLTRYLFKARLAFADLSHLWRRRDIRLSNKGRVYCSAVRSVLLYGSETWPVRVEDIRRLLVFNHRCLQNIARISWDHR